MSSDGPSTLVENTVSLYGSCSLVPYNLVEKAKGSESEHRDMDAFYENFEIIPLISVASIK